MQCAVLNTCRSVLCAPTVLFAVDFLFCMAKIIHLCSSSKSCAQTGRNNFSTHYAILHVSLFFVGSAYECAWVLLLKHACVRMCLCMCVYLFVCFWLFMCVGTVCAISLVVVTYGPTLHETQVVFLAVLPAVGLDLYRAINVNFQSHDDMQWCRVLLPGPL